MFLPTTFIEAKRAGRVHTPAEMQKFFKLYMSGEIPDYQVSAWLMATYFKGLSHEETLTLTDMIRRSGAQLDLLGFHPRVVDKHSTGGVGDKTSMICGPVAAAAGVCVPMIAGRGLGHTGGTLDKLESIPGFRIDLEFSEFYQLMEQHGLAIMGQTENLCPLDRKLYALRDVTSTVEVMGLICASIMGKKLAENLSALVLDVKFGNGAFFVDFSDAQKLAALLKNTGEAQGVITTCLLTDMNAPLGSAVGNANEITECLKILSNEKCLAADGADLLKDLRDLSLELAAHMILNGGLAQDLSEAKKLAIDQLESGRALALFSQLIKSQGGQLEALAGVRACRAQISVEVGRSGFVSGFDTKRLGWLAVSIGAGRKTTADKIDYSAGINIQVYMGQRVTAGTQWAQVFFNSDVDEDSLRLELAACIVVSDEPPPTYGRIRQVM